MCIFLSQTFAPDMTGARSWLSTPAEHGVSERESFVPTRMLAVLRDHTGITAILETFNVSRATARLLGSGLTEVPRQQRSNHTQINLVVSQEHTHSFTSQKHTDSSPGAAPAVVAVER